MPRSITPWLLQRSGGRVMSRLTLAGASLLALIGFLSPGARAEEPVKTALAHLASAMKPGEWKELTTEGYVAELLQAQTHHILEYTSAATWDPKSRQVLFVGQGHYSALKFISYSADTNAWKLRTTPPWWKGDPKTGKGPIGHAYFNNSIDQANGVLYHHQSATRLVHRYDVAKDEWTTLAEIKEAA